MEEVRWGIVGCGDVAEFKSGPALYGVPNSRLVAVMSRREEKARSFAERHGADRHYTSAQDLIQDPEINAIYIGTPPNVHPEITAMAAGAGKHVLAEKPMANTVEECESMIRVCDEAGVQLMIAYYRRFFPVVQKMKQFVSDGRIGDVLRVSASMSYPFDHRADGERAWLVDPDVAGGGFMADIGTHRLDLFSYFCGPASRVAALVATQSMDIAVDDADTVLIEFANGIQGSATMNWNAGVVVDEFEILGTSGRLSTQSLSTDGDLVIQTSEGTETWSQPAPSPVHLHLVEHFVSCLRSGSPNGLDGHAGIEATRLSEAAYLSGKTRAFVDL